MDYSDATTPDNAIVRPAIWHGRWHMQAAPPHGFHWSALRRLQGCRTVQKTEKGARAFASLWPHLCLCVWHLTLYSTGCVCVFVVLFMPRREGALDKGSWVGAEQQLFEGGQRKGGMMSCHGTSAATTFPRLEIIHILTLQICVARYGSGSS
jgi:hypothetical protein